MTSLLNKVFPQGDPFNFSWQEICKIESNPFLRRLLCRPRKIDVKEIAQNRAMKEAKKLADWEKFQDRMAASRLRAKWAEQDKDTPKPRLPKTIMIRGVRTPYEKISSFDFWTCINMHVEAMCKIESNPAVREFIRTNWDSRDDFDGYISLFENDTPLYFLDNPLADEFNKFLWHMHHRDNFAKELIGRFNGATHYPFSFVRTR